MKTFQTTSRHRINHTIQRQITNQTVWTPNKNGDTNKPQKPMTCDLEAFKQEEDQKRWIGSVNETI